MSIKLEKLAKRIGEISEEIKEAISQREINLNTCTGSECEDFNRAAVFDKYTPAENCLTNAFEYVKEDRSENLTTSFSDTLDHYGCINCKGAYKEKQKIGKLKQERGRIVGNISKIGKSLGESK